MKKRSIALLIAFTVSMNSLNVAASAVNSGNVDETQTVTLEESEILIGTPEEEFTEGSNLDETLPEEQSKAEEINPGEYMQEDQSEPEDSVDLEPSDIVGSVNEPIEDAGMEFAEAESNDISSEVAIEGDRGDMLAICEDCEIWPIGAGATDTHGYILGRDCYIKVSDSNINVKWTAADGKNVVLVNSEQVSEKGIKEYYYGIEIKEDDRGRTFYATVQNNTSQEISPHVLNYVSWKGPELEEGDAYQPISQTYKKENGTYVAYYTFKANESGIYSIVGDNITEYSNYQAWIGKEIELDSVVPDSGNAEGQTLQRNTGHVLCKGDTWYIRVEGPASATVGVKKVSGDYVKSGETLTLEPQAAYLYTPTVSGTFKMFSRTASTGLEYYEWKTGTWIPCGAVQNNRYKYECSLDMEAGKEYWLRNMDKSHKIAIGLPYTEVELDKEYVLLQQGEFWEDFPFTPSEDGYYYVDTTASEISLGYQTGKDVPVDGKIVKAVKMKGGETYYVETYDEGGETFTVKKLDQLPIPVKLELDGEGQMIPAGGSGYFELTIPAPNVACYLGMSSNQEFDFEFSYDPLTYSTLNTSGWKWLAMETEYDEVSRCLIFPRVTEDTQIVFQTQLPEVKFREVQDGSRMNLAPNETVYIKYTANHADDFYIDITEGAVTGTGILGQNASAFYYKDSTGENDELDIIRLRYDGRKDVLSYMFLLALTNTGDTDAVIECYDFLSSEAELIVVESLEQLYGEDEKTNYFSFTAPETKLYQINCSSWIWGYRETDHSSLDKRTFLLEKGEKVILCAGDALFIKQYQEVHYITGGDTLTLEHNQYYILKPSKDTTYWLIRNGRPYSNVYQYNKNRPLKYNKGDRIPYDYEEEKYCLKAKAGQTYYLCAAVADETTALLKAGKDIKVFDYDYYEAFVASGGAVSVDGDISQGTADWTLQSAVKNFIDSSISGISRFFSKTNLYWKDTTEGDYVASDYYKVSNDKLEKIDIGKIEDYGVVIAKYQPQIVWVQSIALEAEQTSLQTGTSMQMQAKLDKGQDKYDFTAEPVLRWESSDDTIASVDGNGKVTANKAGNVTITVYADEALRRQEGLDDVVKASVELTVSDQVILPVMQPYAKVSLGQMVVMGDEPRIYYFIPEKTGEYYLEYSPSEKNPYAYWYKAADDKRIEQIRQGVCRLSADRQYYVKVYNANYGDSFRIVRKGEQENKTEIGQEVELKNTFIGRRFYFTPEESGIYYLETSSAKDSADWYSASDDEKCLTGVEGRYTLNKGGQYYIEVSGGDTGNKISVLKDTRFSSSAINLWPVGRYTAFNSPDGYGHYFSFSLQPRMTYYLDFQFTGSPESADPQFFVSPYVQIEKVDHPDPAIVRYALRIEYGCEDIISDVQYMMVLTSAALPDSKVTVKFYDEKNIVNDEIKLFSIDPHWDDLSDTWVYDAEEVKQEQISPEIFIVRDESLAWKSTNEKIAYMESQSDGRLKLVIAQGAPVGKADITITAGTDQYTFYVIISDGTVRLGTESLKMNSYSNQWERVYLSPNSQLGYEITDVEILQENSPFELNRNDDGTVYHKNGGYVEVRYKDSDSVRFNRETFTLQVTQSLNGKTRPSEEVSVAVTNKPVLPKTTIKVQTPYNIFWKNNNACATLLIKSEEEIRSVKKTDWDTSVYEILEDSLARVKGKTGQWTVQVRAKDSVRIGAPTVNVEIEYADYWISSVGTIKMKTVNKTPVFKVYGATQFAPMLYPELGRDVTVLVELPEGIDADDLTLAEASQKLFDIKENGVSTVENYSVVTDKKGARKTIEKAALITLTAKESNGKIKSGKVQFRIDSEQLTQPALTKKLKVTAKALHKVKLLLPNADTGNVKPTYTFQKRWAGKEELRLCPVLSDADIKNYKVTYTVIKGNADSLEITEDPLSGAYILKASEKAFNQSSSCKIAFTAEIMGEDGTVIASLKRTTVNLKFKSADASVSVKGTAKGTLNLVDPESKVIFVPVFKNLPLGADVTLAKADDFGSYEYFENENTKTIEIRKKKGIRTAIGKGFVNLSYTIVCGDASETVSTSVPIKTVQKASLKADTQSITLYNSSPGINYGRRVGFSITKPAGAEIEKIIVTGLEDSGISCKLDVNQKAVFYVNAYRKRGKEQVYKANITVMLKDAGMKKGTISTYTFPLTVDLKN